MCLSLIKQYETSLVVQTTDFSSMDHEEIKQNNLTETTPLTQNTTYILSDNDDDDSDIDTTELLFNLSKTSHDMTLAQHGYKKKRIMCNVYNILRYLFTLLNKKTTLY